MSAYLDWRVGMRVVCVDDQPSDGRGEVYPVESQVYTIRALSLTDDGQVKIRLVEIVNAPMAYRQGFHECWFRARRFRPVQARKTDISIFTALLNPSQRDREYIELEDLEHSEPHR